MAGTPGLPTDVARALAAQHGAAGAVAFVQERMQEAAEARDGRTYNYWRRVASYLMASDLSANPFVPALERFGLGFSRHPAHAKRPLRGLVLYEGPSPLGGVVARGRHGRMGRMASGDVVVVATLGSENKKTGNMIQTWILLKDVNPNEALLSGLDSAICGFCPHRAEGTKAGSDPRRGTFGKVIPGSRSCYVNMRYVTTIWKAYKRGVYRKLDEDQLGPAFRALGEAGYYMRLGSYGDPAAVPLWVWDRVLGLDGNATLPVEPTCYTHQWSLPTMQGFRDFCMASVDSAEEADAAQTLGWRTFRVGLRCGPNEVLCPASAEFGRIHGARKVRTCAQCRLCCGNKRAGARSIFIPPHGSGAGYASRRLRNPCPCGGTCGCARGNPQDDDLRVLARASLVGDEDARARLEAVVARGGLPVAQALLREAGRQHEIGRRAWEALGPDRVSDRAVPEWARYMNAYATLIAIRRGLAASLGFGDSFMWHHGLGAWESEHGWGGYGKDSAEDLWSKGNPSDDRIQGLRRAALLGDVRAALALANEARRVGDETLAWEALDTLVEAKRVAEEHRRSFFLPMHESGDWSGRDTVVASREYREAGRYDPGTAHLAWLEWVNAGAKRYGKEFREDVRTRFPAALRHELAVRWARHFESDPYDGLKRPRDHRDNPVPSVPEGAPLRVDCAWCGARIRGPETGPISHGICRACFAKEMPGEPYPSDEKKNPCRRVSLAVAKRCAAARGETVELDALVAAYVAEHGRLPRSVTIS